VHGYASHVGGGHSKQDMRAPHAAEGPIATRPHRDAQRHPLEHAHVPILDRVALSKGLVRVMLPS
jgi:hypothetical protein